MANTTTVPVASEGRKSRPFQAILWGGLIVGVLDLAYAIVMYSPQQPILIPQTIASGVLGARAYDGGMATAALGVFFHFLIAFGAATVYLAASRKLAVMTRHAVICGLLYGAIVFVFMHAVVLPLSAVAPSRMALPARLAEFVEHWFLVGLPIALSVRRFSPR
jgi:uncharacterized membrane protein YagU involved in acid resistance